MPSPGEELDKSHEVKAGRGLKISFTTPSFSRILKIFSEKSSGLAILSLSADCTTTLVILMLMSTLPTSCSTSWVLVRELRRGLAPTYLLGEASLCCPTWTRWNPFSPASLLAISIFLEVFLAQEQGWLGSECSRDEITCIVVL